MISYQKDASSQLLKSYLPPFRGTWKTLPPYLLPEDVVFNSSNITLLGGKLRSRCGLKVYDRVNFEDKILGSFMTVDTNNNKYPLASTKSKLYRYIQGAWEDITNITQLTATNENTIRMSSLQLGDFVYVLYANGKDTLKILSQQDYSLLPITPLQGTIPVCTDICTSFSRFLGITPPYIVQWCDVINDSYLSFTNWPSLNQAILADTEDSLVAIRSLGTLGVAVYKEGNIFVGFAQAGSNAQAFRFDHRGEYEGPASPNAVINIDGTHMYMTPTGRIAIFDGTNHSFICDGIWPFLQDTLDLDSSHKIFGVYDYQIAQATFYYPGITDNGECKSLITIVLPFPLSGIQSYSYFLGNVNFECTNGLSMKRYNSRSSPLIFGANNITLILDKNTYTDNWYSFNCSFQTGLMRPPSADEKIRDKSDIYSPTLELYATRDSNRGTVNVSAITSNSLENDGNITNTEEIDLTQVLPNEFIAFNETGSYLGANFEWNSESRFEYKGCDLYGRKTG